MKRFALVLSLMFITLAANAQFEKGKWFINPSITGLHLTHNTIADKTSFGLEAKGGYFFAKDFAAIAQVGADWNTSYSNADVYDLGAGIRYYFDNIGIYVSGMALLESVHNTETTTRFGGDFEVGYAFFLNDKVSIDPAFHWSVNGDGSDLGLKLGFAIYF